MRSLIVAVLLLAATYTAAAQACGGSEFTFTLFVPNGKEAKNAKYRVYPVTRVAGGADQKWLEQTFGRGQELTGRATWSQRPTRLRGDEGAEDFVKSYDTKLYKPQDTRWGRKNELEGMFKNGEATFFTAETDSTPYLLEIKADGFETAYILGSFMGGCRQHADVVLYPAAPHSP